MYSSNDDERDLSGDDERDLSDDEDDERDLSLSGLRSKSPQYQDRELIEYHLKTKILRQHYPSPIPTAHVYASSPDKLPLDEIKAGQRNEWFFFSTKSKDDEITVIDGGYYEIDPDGAAPITWKGKTVGYVKTLIFYQGSPPNGTETGWIVEELSVNPEVIPVHKAGHSSTQEKIANLVVCKILRVPPPART